MSKVPDWSGMEVEENAIWPNYDKVLDLFPMAQEKWSYHSLSFEDTWVKGCKISLKANIQDVRVHFRNIYPEIIQF